MPPSNELYVCCGSSVCACAWTCMFVLCMLVCSAAAGRYLRQRCRMSLRCPSARVHFAAALFHTDRGRISLVP